MSDDDGGTLQVVAWSELCPWLSLFRTFRLAIGFRVLLLSAVAISLTIAGWVLFGWLFSGYENLPHQVASDHACPWLAITEVVPDRPSLSVLPGVGGGETSAEYSASEILTARRATDPCVGPWLQLSRPFRQIFDPQTRFSDLVYLLLCGLWALAVWAFFGGAISRIAAVRLAREEQVSWAAMMRHVRSKWRAYFAAPLFPLAGVLLIAAVVALFGLLLRAGPGMLIAGLIWPLMLVAGLLMTMLLLGLVFGWPLMWATISTEGSDSFDALSRSYAYVFQRPLHYLFYAIVATGFGLLGWLLVANFAAGVVGLTYWAAGWGAGGQPERLVADATGGTALIGASLIGFWVGCVKMLAVGFLYSFFWTAAAAIYLLLRRDVDATEMDEVFLEEDEDEPAYGLPPLETDDAGAPVMADDNSP